MKILIADDERMIRLSLISMLDELYPEIHTYIEASNGNDFINKCIGNQPDLAFVDIKMPLMNGLDAIQHSLKNSPETAFIIFSGYPDFSFAQKAIKLGCVDYIVKPASLSIIKKTVDSIVEQKKINNKSGQKLFGYEIINSYTSFPVMQSVEATSYLDKPLLSFILYCDSFDNSVVQYIYNEIKKSTIDSIENKYSAVPKYMFFYLYDGDLCFVVSTDEPMIRYINFFRLLLQQFNTAISVIYLEQSSIETLIPEIINVSKRKYLRLVCNYGNFINFEDLLIFRPEIISFCEKLEALMLFYLGKNKVQFRDTLDSLKKFQNIPFLKNSKIWSNISKYINTILNTNFSISSIEVLLKKLNSIESEMLSDTENDTHANIVDKVKSYIDHYYMDDIGINTIADYFHITPNYLSTIFKNKTGIKFIDYLTELRISHAKDILKTNPDIPISELALKIGYNGSRHFSKIFQKYTGKLPSEYKKNDV